MTEKWHWNDTKMSERSTGRLFQLHFTWNDFFFTRRIKIVGYREVKVKDPLAPNLERKRREKEEREKEEREKEEREKEERERERERESNNNKKTEWMWKRE